MNDMRFYTNKMRTGKNLSSGGCAILQGSHSEMYSTSGDFDLLLKIYVPEGKDVGRYINELIGPIEGIQRTLTTLTFSAF